MTKSKFSKEFNNLLNIDRLLGNTENKENLKVTLKKDQIKGTGMYATQFIKKEELIAYYKVLVYNYKKYNSPTNYIYAFDIYNKSGKESKYLIGDIYLDSFPEPVNNVPFWAPFVNEPSIGQQINAKIDLNFEENYKNKNRIKDGSEIIYKLIAFEDIFPGDEITIYYGEDYPRTYKIDIKTI
jgi:hypothetical protein